MTHHTCCPCNCLYQILSDSDPLQYQEPFVKKNSINRDIVQLSPDFLANYGDQHVVGSLQLQTKSHQGSTKYLIPCIPNSKEKHDNSMLDKTQEKNLRRFST